MTTKILPLGTIITLKNGDDDKLMIISRASVIEENGESIYYDYGSVLVPQGMLAPDAVYFFNRENVKEIVFRGFENDEEVEFANQYEEMVGQTDLKKGNVTSSEDEGNFGF